MALNDPLELILYLAVAALVIWLIFYVIGKAGLPETPRLIITVVVAIIVLVWLLRTLVPGIL